MLSCLYIGNPFANGNILHFIFPAMFLFICPGAGWYDVRSTSNQDISQCFQIATMMLEPKLQ